MTLSIGSLFSGIGGLELGLEWSGLGPVLWQVEIDPRSREVLARHWPDADRSVCDVRTASASLLAPVDLVCGGFPCQDLSSAGARRGLGGDRSGLWYEMLRVVREIAPRLVVVENVAGGASNWVDRVRGDLEGLGFSSLPIALEASSLGALHRRARVFILATHPARAESPHEWMGAAPDTNGHALRIEPGRRGRPWSGATVPNLAPSALADSDAPREPQPLWGERPERRWHCNGALWSAEPDMARVVYGLSRRMARERSFRERALGLSVVPHVACVVGSVIVEMLSIAPSDRGAP
jgi:DNA (cytosine-5)-methyltransferase 1